MNRTQQKELTREVKKLLKKRSEYTGVSKWAQLALRLLAGVALLGAIFTFGFGLITYRSLAESATIDAIYLWLWASSILCASLFFVLISLRPPKSRQRLDNWFLWRGRAAIVLGIGVWVLQVVNQMLPSTVNFFGANRYIIVISYTCAAVFILTIGAILSKPELFLAEWLTGIASGCFLFVLATMPMRFAALLPIDYGITWILSALMLLLLSVSMELGTRYKPGRLNLVQEAVISIISPSQLLQSMRTHNEIIRDQYEALQIKLRLEDDLPIGINRELVKLFAAELKKDKKPLGLIVAIALLIVEAIADNLISDFIYNDLLKPFLCSVVKAACD